MSQKPISEVLKDRNIVIVGGDALSQSGFTQIPNAALRSDDLAPGEKLAYAMLLSYAWTNDFCFPGQERLGTDMGVTRSTANGWLMGLKKKGWIKVQRRGQGMTNLYEVNLKAKVLKIKNAQ